MLYNRTWHMLDNRTWQMLYNRTWHMLYNIRLHMLYNITWHMLYNMTWECYIARHETCYITYTCQLFLSYKRETFILGVLGFLQTTRSFPKISEVFRRRPKSAEGDFRENTYPQNQRSRGRYCHLFSLHMVFVPCMGLS